MWLAVVASVIFLPRASDESLWPLPQTQLQIVDAASADVTAGSAVIHAHTNGPGTVHVDYGTDPLLIRFEGATATVAPRAGDYSAAVQLKQLAPDTVYYFGVWFSGIDRSGISGIATGISGSFRTAPDPARSGAPSSVARGIPASTAHYHGFESAQP